uniref:Uncharacterized protein n=1 Tax=Brassica oleracea var. oleracea TaxID=109376 RepID=A0A0D3C429_BRAOL
MLACATSSLATLDQGLITKSVDITFALASSGIVTASADCSILATDVETGASVAHLEHAHEDAVNTLITVTETTIASGDDQGCVKIWDTRQRSCSHEFNVHEDYISCMTFASDSMKLVATSGDGTLSVCNLRTSSMRIELSPGCDNGIISLVGILPNRIIQPIGSHEFPIEDLAHDSMLKLWDLEEIIEGSNGNASGGESDSDNEEMDLDNDPKPSRATFWNILKHFFLEISTKRKTKSKPTPVDTKTSFFADM